MGFEPFQVLATGGAGFIGSHLVDTLMAHGVNVRILDNFSSGRPENIKRWLKNPNFMIKRGDLLNPTETAKAVENCEVVFHLAANPEVRMSSIIPNVHFNQNVAITYNLLEAIRRFGNIETFIFTSSSTVYGEAIKIPTPENYAPLTPISIHGACKLACETLITAYAHTYGFKAIIYRLANIVGPRSSHGVIHDFIQKLNKNLSELEILGDGNQSKSYLYIDDCVRAMLLGLEKTKRQVEVFNIGSEDQVDVRTIAKIVIEEMGLKEARFRFTGGVEGGRGWKGDVRYMLLDTNKLRSLGWKPKLDSAEAVRTTIKDILKEYYLTRLP